MYLKIRNALFFVVILSVLLICAFIFMTSQGHLIVRSQQPARIREPGAVNSSQIQQPAASRRNQTHPLILYWGSPWGVPGYTPVEGSTMGDCINSNDGNKLDKADIVVFHYTVMKNGMVPWKHYRDPHQVYVWWSAENPAVTGTEFSAYDGFFNWTWTYRLDADVHRGYGNRDHALKAVQRGPKVVDDLVAGKKKLALWFASNCGVTRGAVERLKYSQQLIDAGLPLERIGGCFGNQNLMPRSDPAAIAKTLRETKFYMAFENSINCTDYVTEKFWDTALQNGAVPVVWGTSKRDVLRVAPLDSFIHTEDFETPRKLADYLKFLDGNDTEYRKYLQWRADESVTDDQMISMIEKKYPGIEPQRKPKSLCEIYLENRKTKVITSLNDEFVKPNSNECIQRKRGK